MMDPLLAKYSVETSGFYSFENYFYLEGLDYENLLCYRHFFLEIISLLLVKIH